MSTVVPFTLSRAETSRRRLAGIWSANVAGGLIATAAASFAFPTEGSILQGALVGVALGIAVIGFTVAFVAGDRMDSLDEVGV
ncbi:hypothetical protein EXE43_09400 [Halorubrum sp. SS5]|nr:hypothetical protein EXE43_09400 [Halorubrum sp. SS5]